MRIEYIKNKKLPDTPGVYFFLGPSLPAASRNAAPARALRAGGQAGRKILYIGKATSLKDRVRSYFSGDLIRARGEHIGKMVDEAARVDFKKTDSVLEALILEANLIKKHKPPYNSRDKDDKSFNYLVITKEEFPRVLIVRGKDLQTTRLRSASGQANYLPEPGLRQAGRLLAAYGPFPHAGQFKEAVKIVRKIFPFYDTKEPVLDIVKTERGRKKLVFNSQIGLYPGMPHEDISKRDYARTIRHIKLFFEGKKGALVKQLEKEMKSFARMEEFEKAAEVRRKIFALKHIQDVALLKSEHHILRPSVLDLHPSASWRVEAYDIAHISGTDTVGVMTVVEDGAPKKSDYRKFRIRGSEFGNDTAALKEILSRRLEHNEWQMPNLIVVDGGKAQINSAERVLRARRLTPACANLPARGAQAGALADRRNKRGTTQKTLVIGVVKDEHHRPREILGERRVASAYEKDILLANAEAHRFAIAYHRKLRKI